jgi:NAD(P)H-dependent flavin oxidoreductase YrpB (nitropropane dioxygenase family)
MSDSQNRYEVIEVDYAPSGLPFAYRRPRCPMRHLRRLIRRFIRLIRRRSRRITRISVQVIVSGGLIAGGITAGLNPIGALLVFIGICLASCQEAESNEEYRLAVIAHYVGEQRLIG